MTNTEYLQKLAEKIKNTRKQKKLTQEKLAEKLGTVPSYVARMEKGEQDSRITSLLELAAALDISIGELVSVY